jgi:hypothetical protein
MPSDGDGREDLDTQPAGALDRSRDHAVFVFILFRSNCWSSPCIYFIPFSTYHIIIIP